MNIKSLSFVQGTNHWDVTPSSDYESDFRTGQAMADETADLLSTLTLLQQRVVIIRIFKDMSTHEFSGISAGFVAQLLTN